VAQVGLTAAGMQVVSAASGPEGVQKARDERPNVIVLDVMMPDVDGYATLARLRADEATAGIPVILLTAKNLTDKESGLRAQGVIDFVNKPFSPRAFAERVERALADLGARPGTAQPAPTTSPS
jgi:CheY-like chemotaxis protein